MNYLGKNFNFFLIIENVQEDPQQRRPTSSEPRPSGIMEFRINWQAVYDKDPQLQRKLERGRRLTPNDRKLVVAEIVQQVRNKIPGATRQTFNQVYEIMILKHRESFEETLGAVGEGHSVKTIGGIRKQLKDKFDNDKRVTSDKPRTRLEVERPLLKAAYGCIRWEVVDYPDGEDEHSLEEKKKLLQTHYKNRRTAGRATVREVQDLMTITYKHQRELINANVKSALETQRLKKRQGQPTTEEHENEDEPQITMLMIRKEFPYLFCFEGMQTHHELLTGVHANNALESFNNEERDKMLQYFATSRNLKIQSINRKLQRQLEREGCNPGFTHLLALIWMVAVELNEDLECLIKLEPVSGLSIR